MSKRLFKGVVTSYDSERGWWRFISMDSRVPAAEMIDGVKPRYDELVLNSGLKNQNSALNEHLVVLSALPEGQTKIAQLNAVDMTLQVHEAMPREERTTLLTSEILNTLKDGFSRLDKRQTQIEAELESIRMTLKGAGDSRTSHLE
ncbi:hypothetical protein H0H93_008903, partial [Arthromyces matolae]